VLDLFSWLLLLDKKHVFELKDKLTLQEEIESMSICCLCI